MTYIKNLLLKVEDLSIGNHLPTFHNLCQDSYGIETMIKLILVPLRVDPLLSGYEAKRVKKVPQNQLKIGQQVAYG